MNPTATPTQDALLELEDASRILRLSKRTVTKLCEDGALAHIDLGTDLRHLFRFRTEDLDAFMQSRAVTVKKAHTPIAKKAAYKQPKFVISVQEAAKRLGKGETTIKEMCMDRRLKAKKHGRVWLIDEKSL